MASRFFAGLPNTFLRGGVLLGAGVVFVESCLYNVDPGHRAVIFDRFEGIKKQVKGEGTHIRIPGI